MEVEIDCLSVRRMGRGRELGRAEKKIPFGSQRRPIVVVGPAGRVDFSFLDQQLDELYEYGVTVRL